MCHVYFDKDGDVAKGAAIIRNAKTRRVSVCNALDCLIVDVNRLTDLSTLCSGLQQDNVEIYADDLCYNYLKTSYPSHLLKHASTDTFGTEFLDYKMAVTATMTIQAAVAHISIYGSGHSECIVTENDRAADYFMKMVDAACVYVNVPTSFTDGGEFGLGTLHPSGRQRGGLRQRVDALHRRRRVRPRLRDGHFHAEAPRPWSDGTRGTEHIQVDYSGGWTNKTIIL